MADRIRGDRVRSGPLIVTGDPRLLDELLRVTADAGHIADVALDAPSARSRFASASLVLIGVDCAAACARAKLPRRGGVLLVRCATDDPLTDCRPAEEIGADHVLSLPDAAGWLVERLRNAQPERNALVVAVLGGRGGAGASVLSGALAMTAARRSLRTMLIDADPLGGGADLVLGWESLAGLRWPALSHASGRVDAEAFVGVLPGRDTLVVLSADRADPAPIPSEAMLAALDAGRRGRDVVVVDLPRTLDAAAEVALVAADRAFLVVPAELRACAAARRVASHVLPHCPHLSVVVRRASAAAIAPAAVAESVGLPLAGVMRNEARLAIALERGDPPAISGRGPLAQLCNRLLNGAVAA